jgi:hypothetical protein
MAPEEIKMKNKRDWCIALIAVGAVVLGLMFAVCPSGPVANGQEEAAAQDALPEGDNGLAARYPGDAGIEQDPDVIFVENFEADSRDALQGDWNEFNNEITSLSDDVPPGSTGKRSLLFTHVGGKGTGGHLYKSFKPGFDQLYLRFYVKFDPACAPIHHFVHLGGYNPPTSWPQGGAGERPQGHDRVTTGLEPYGEAWRWDFYSYWMEQRGNPVPNKYWGNDFINDDGLQVKKGQWVCVEGMVKLNDPVTEYNGEMALWIDGKLHRKDGQILSHLRPGSPRGKWVWDSFLPDPNGEPFEGFRWRNSEELQLNFLWLLVYITKAPEGHVSKVWFDDVVLAKKYLGPLKAR